MKKTFSICFFALFVLASCNSSVRFGISQKYKLNKDEHNVKLDDIIVKKYENIINIDTLNYPLNKYIVSKNYKIFIGVSFNSKTKDIVNFYQNNETYYVFDANLSENENSMYFNKDAHFLYSYIYDSKKDKLTYFLTLEADSTTCIKMYKSDYLKTRLNE